MNNEKLPSGECGSVCCCKEDKITKSYEIDQGFLSGPSSLFCPVS